jgi:hypothetical protein
MNHQHFVLTGQVRITENIRGIFHDYERGEP